MSNNIGDRISDLRAKTGLNQREMAKKLGIHESTLSNIESGRRLPSYELLAKIVEELKIDFNQVMGSEIQGKVKARKRRKIKGCPPRHKDLVLWMFLKTGILNPLFRLDLIIDAYPLLFFSWCKRFFTGRF